MIQNAHVVSISGGMCSFFTAKRVKEKFGSENLYLVFADTRIEDEDLYRFLKETLEYLEGHFIYLASDKSVWDTFFDSRFLGNNRIDPCSRILKREPLRKWITKNIDPETSTLYFGFDIEEGHRFKRCAELWLPYASAAPLMEKPYITRPMMLDELKKLNIKPPRLYEMGFLHNNCGGFCVKAGQKQFKLLYEKFPERFEYHRQEEEALRAFLGKNISILKKQKNNVQFRYTLTQMKEDLDAQKQIEEDDWGGCQSCFSPDE